MLVTLERMSLLDQIGNNDQLFNNADSFSMVFDEEWKKYKLKNVDKKFNRDEILNQVLEKLKGHPFLINSPDEAKNVANFRIRLLGLD